MINCDLLETGILLLCLVVLYILVKEEMKGK